MTIRRILSGAGLALLLLTSGGKPPPLMAAQGVEIRLTSDSHSYMAAWAPDGRSLLLNRPGEVVISGTGWQVLPQLWQLSLEGEAQTLSDNAIFPAYSPDGKAIAYLSFVTAEKGQLWLLEGGKSKALGLADWGLPPVWLPDGRLAFAREGQLFATDREGQEEAMATTIYGRIFRLSPQGEKVAIEEAGVLQVKALEDEPSSILSTGATIGPLAWSPDGTRLAYVTIDEELRSRLWVAEADGSIPLLLAESEDEHFGPPTWSPDGQKMAFSRCPRGSATAQGCDLWLADLPGGGLFNLTPGQEEESAPLWSPDGRYLAFQREGDVWLLDLEGTPSRPIPTPPKVQPTLPEPIIPLGSPAIASLSPPSTIRVLHDPSNYYRSDVPPWRIDLFDFEAYVKYVVTCEVPRSWEPEALKAQAVAARSFGWYYVLNNYHLRSDKWDVTDWTNDQCVRPVEFPEIGAAVEATRGQYLWHNQWDDGAPPLDSPIIAMYSARNGDPTRTRSDNPARFPYLKAVNDPVSFGDSRYGHGYGLSQWGAQRWASWHGWNYQQILTHYYTAVTVEAPAETGSDATPPLASPILPWSDSYLTSPRALLVANASDGNSGMNRVEFWARYHDGASVEWHHLATDSDGSDGWSYLWNLSSLPDQPLTAESIEISIKATDNAGNESISQRSALVGFDRAVPSGTTRYYQASSALALFSFASDSGGSGLQSMAFSHDWIWEGEDLYHQSGRRIDDGQALNGKAWLGQKGLHSPGYWYGPYTKVLPLGRPYRVYFRLRTNDVTTTQEVAFLDVVDEYGQSLLGLLRLRGIDFRAPNTYQEFGVDLNYVAQGSAGLEFRTYFTGAADLALDRVMVVTYPEPYQNGLILDPSQLGGLRVKFLDGASNISADSIPTPIDLPLRTYLPLIFRNW